MNAKEATRRVALTFGFEIRRAFGRPSLINFVKDRKIDVVFDVGANKGQFGRSLRRSGYKGKIISFEPVSSAFKELDRAARADGNWEARNHAVGAANGEIKINVAEASVFSSALAIKPWVAPTFHAGARTTATETVAVSTLDSVDVEGSSSIFVKVDTQGFERQVIDGGKTTVARAKGVLLELPVVALYEGSWRFGDAISYMHDLGFVPAQIDPVCYHRIDQQAVMEIDCLFRPISSDVD